MRWMIAAAIAWMVVASAQAQSVPESALHTALGSPENWRIRGTFRIRGEGIDNQFRPSPIAHSDTFLSLRTTVFAEYSAGPVRFGAELFDSRGYFEKTRSSVGTTEINAFELGQAYIGFDFGRGAANRGSLTLGRFTFDDGSRRLIARNQFRNTINAFTGARVDWQDAAKDRLLLFYTLPQRRLPDEPARIQQNPVEWDRESFALQFYGGSFTKANVLAGGTLEIHGYQLDERDTPYHQTRNRRLFTPGIRLARAPRAAAFDWDFEGIYQTGKSRLSTNITDTRDLNTEAWFYHAEIGRTFNATWSPRIALQYDRASGNGTNASRYSRFDTLFGARRGEYGPTSLYGAIQRANLSSPALRIEVTPDKRWDGFVAWRPLWLENRTDSFASTGVRDRTGRSGLYAGNQIEARARYWLIPKIARFDGGFAWLVKDGVLSHAPNAAADGDTRYGYLDLTFNF